MNKDTERSSLNWHIKKDGYPSNDNEALEDYITKVTNDIETMVSDFNSIQYALFLKHYGMGGGGIMAPPCNFAVS